MPQAKLLSPVTPTFRLSAGDRIVVLLGPTGAGKSTFIEYATQEGGTTIGHGLQPCTSDIRAVRCVHPVDGKPVVFVDTPGFDDTYKSDVGIMGLISGWFAEIHEGHVPLACIVYVHRISDNRMPAGSPLENLRMFANMCGQERMPRVAIGTTMWSEVKTETGERRDKELRAKFWKDMISEGCTVDRFGDSHGSAWDIIGTLAENSAVRSLDTLPGSRGLVSYNAKYLSDRLSYYYKKWKLVAACGACIFGATMCALLGSWEVHAHGEAEFLGFSRMPQIFVTPDAKIGGTEDGNFEFPDGSWRPSTGH